MSRRWTLDRFGREVLLHVVEGMGDKMDDLLLSQISHELVDVLPQMHEIVIDRFRDVERNDMQLGLLFRYIGGHFRADERVRQVGDLQ